MSLYIAGGGVGMVITHRNDKIGYVYDEAAGDSFYNPPFITTKSTVLSGIGAAWGIVSVGLAIELRFRDEAFSIEVYSGDDDSKEAPYVLVDDIQAYFPDATTFKYGSERVNFIRDANHNL
ncbi:MAG: hypothetical protein J3R72DRAFT_428002 [Linnemannia gamsii]|nr:MAG: hypothetical protein J3R72DRAFT_428002 [Linnemannia gamsii]